MSFILEALKKSEERRRLHDAARPPQAKVLDLNRPGSRRWSAGLLLVLLLAALAGGWWLRGASQPDPAVSRSGGEPLPATPTPSYAPPQVAGPPLAESDKASSPRVATRPAPFAPVPEPAREAGGTSAPEHPAVSRSAVAPSGAGLPDGRPVPAAPGAGPRPGPREIPTALRNRTPELTMSLHFYTEEPARRMVRIDNRIVREGQTVSDNLVLETITPEGAILSFAGERFELRGPGNER